LGFVLIEKNYVLIYIKKNDVKSREKMQNNLKIRVRINCGDSYLFFNEKGRVV